MKRHACGMRPSFKIGQRRYFRSLCGVRIYGTNRARSRGELTCLRCIAIGRVRRRERRAMAKQDRIVQLQNYRARRKRENVMRARFGLKPVKYEPPPPSDYWSSW